MQHEEAQKYFTPGDKDQVIAILSGKCPHNEGFNVVNDALAKQRTFEILSSQISHLPFKTTLREIRWAIDENSRTTR